MEKEKLEKLSILIDEEQRIRYEWKEAVQKLQSLVSKATKHNRVSCEFWNKNLNEQDQIVVNTNDETFLIKRPKLEDASMEVYLPYGIDFKKITSLDIE